MTDDVVHSTQYNKYIKRAILANLQCRSLKLGRLIVLQETPMAVKNYAPMATHSFPVPTLLISMLVIFSSKMLNEATNLSQHIYMLAGSCI